MGQLGIVVVSTEVKLIFYSREPRMCVCGGGGGVGVGVGGCAGVCLRLRPPGPLFFSWQDLFGPRPLPSPFPKCL